MVTRKKGTVKWLRKEDPCIPVFNCVLPTCDTQGRWEGEQGMVSGKGVISHLVTEAVVLTGPDRGPVCVDTHFL